MGDAVYPYNNREFLERCVAIWRAHGARATVTWEWPDGLACPDATRSAQMLHFLAQDEHLHFVLNVWTVIMVVTCLPCLCLCCSRVRVKTRRSSCTCELVV